MMGGRIWVESESGVGSQFHFTARLGIAEAREAVAENTGGPAVLRGVNVLIVDDNRTNRRILEGLVKRWGMNPTVTSDGEMALIALTAARETDEPYGLILTDMMPKMDGFGLVENIKKSTGSRWDERCCRVTAGGACSARRVGKPCCSECVEACR